MGNCCINIPLLRSKYCSLFSNRNRNGLSGEFDTLMDLDFLEEPQLTFRINETPFTVFSYLDWISNRPHTNLQVDDDSSRTSTLSSRNGTASKLISKIARSGVKQSSPVSGDTENTSSEGTQKLLFRELDPKSRPPPVQISRTTSLSSNCLSTPPYSKSNGNWMAVTNLTGPINKASTSALFMGNKTTSVRTSLQAEPRVQEEEMDGPEIGRLMRRFWQRDFNFLRLNWEPVSTAPRNGLPKSLHQKERRQNRSAARPRHLRLRDTSADVSNGTTHSSSNKNEEFDFSMDLDWDDELGVGLAPDQARRVRPLSYSSATRWCAEDSVARQASPSGRLVASDITIRIKAQPPHLDDSGYDNNIDSRSDAFCSDAKV